MFSSLRLKLSIIMFYEKKNLVKKLKVYYTPKKKHSKLVCSGDF